MIQKNTNSTQIESNSSSNKTLLGKKDFKLLDGYMLQKLEEGAVKQKKSNEEQVDSVTLTVEKLKEWKTKKKMEELEKGMTLVEKEEIYEKENKLDTTEASLIEVGEELEKQMNIEQSGGLSLLKDAFETEKAEKRVEKKAAQSGKEKTFIQQLDTELIEDIEVEEQGEQLLDSGEEMEELAQKLEQAKMTWDKTSEAEYSKQLANRLNAEDVLESKEEELHDEQGEQPLEEGVAVEEELEQSGIVQPEDLAQQVGQLEGEGDWGHKKH